jgi:hypothetical protein
VSPLGEFKSSNRSIVTSELGATTACSHSTPERFVAGRTAFFVGWRITAP